MSDRDERSTHIFRIHIRATPQAIWNAITTPEWTARYGYRVPVEYDLRPGGAFRSRTTPEAEPILDGEVIEADPPRRLVQTWRPAWNGEPATRLTYDIDAGPDGVSRLTLTHEVAGAPKTEADITGAVPEAGGGWAMILSDMKTLLETGRPMAAA